MASEVLTAESRPTDPLVTSAAIFVGGVAVGAIAALLLAPQAGRESRKQLSEYCRRTGETMREWATAASDLFATGATLNGAAQNASEKKSERNDVVMPRPQAMAH